MKPFSRLGLRGRLLLILLTAFAALSGLVAWQSLIQRNESLQAASRHLLNHAKLVAARQHSLLERGDAILNSLMLASILGHGPADGQCGRVLAERLGSEPAFVQMGRAAPDGTVSCMAVPGAGEVHVGDQSWFRLALQGRQTIVSEVAVAPAFGQRVIYLAKALRDEAGKVEGVFYLALGFDWLQQELARTGLPEGARVVVVDGEGSLVVRYPAQAEWACRHMADHPLVRHVLADGGEGVTRNDGLDGVSRVIGFTPLFHSASGRRYHLWLSQPTAQVEGPAHRQLASGLGIALTILAVTLALVYWGSYRYLVQPLRLLSRTARRFGTGDLAASSELPQADGEIGELARSLENMAAALRDSTVSRQRLQIEVEAHQGAQERLRLALEGADAGSFEWNIDTGQSTWSEKVWLLLGLERNAAPASYETWQRTIHGEDLERVAGAIDYAVARGAEFEAEWRVASVAGTDGRWLMARGRPLREADDRIVRYFGVVMDISERKQSEQALQRYRHHLEALVAERTAELTAANKDLEGFTYAASHDMKGPLGRINSFCTLLGQRYRSHLEGEGITLLDLIQQNAQRLNVLVEDLLAHVQVSQHSLQPQAVDIPAVVHAVLQERAQDIRKHGAEVRLDLPDRLTACGSHLGIVLMLRNLLENALKYSSVAQPPRIEIGGRKEEGNCRLWVRDNGIGIDAAHHEKIFEIFRRLHSYAEYPGNGIGLALVRKAMERMGGRVWVESEAGRGATFFVELAAGSDEAATPPPAPRRPD